MSRRRAVSTLRLAPPSPIVETYGYWINQPSQVFVGAARSGEGNGHCLSYHDAYVVDIA